MCPARWLGSVRCPPPSSQRFWGHGVPLSAAKPQILWDGPCLLTGPADGGRSLCRVAGGRSSGGGVQMCVWLARLSESLPCGPADCAAYLVTGPSGHGRMLGRVVGGRSSGGRFQTCVWQARLSLWRFGGRVDRAAGASSAMEEGQADAKSGSPAPSLAGVGRGCARRYATRLPRRLCCEGGGTRSSSR